MIQNSKRILLVTICLCLLTACNWHHDSRPDILIHKYQAVNSQGWNDHDTVVINIPEVDSTRVYSPEYEVRLLRNYAYTNLQLRIRVDEVEPLHRLTTVHNLYRCDTLYSIPDSTHADRIAKTLHYTLFRSDTATEDIRHIYTRSTDKVSFKLFEACKDADRQSTTFAWSQARGKQLLLEKGKTYQIKITHNMRERSLAGVVNVGVQLSY